MGLSLLSSIDDDYNLSAAAYAIYYTYGAPAGEPAVVA